MGEEGATETTGTTTTGVGEGANVLSGGEEVGSRKKTAEELQKDEARRKRLAYQESLERLTTGNFSVWQMAKSLGPRRARKMGLEMQRVSEKGEGIVKTVFLGHSQNYKSKSRAAEAQKRRYRLAKLKDIYGEEKEKRRAMIEALRREREGKIESKDVIDLSYRVRPQTGQSGRGMIFPSKADYRRALTAPTEINHEGPWDGRFGVPDKIRAQSRSSQRSHGGQPSSLRSRYVSTPGSRPHTSAMDWDWAGGFQHGSDLAPYPIDTLQMMTRAETPHGHRPSTVGFAPDTPDRNNNNSIGRRAQSRSGLRPSFRPPTAEERGETPYGSPKPFSIADRPRTVSTPYARQIVPAGSRSSQSNRLKRRQRKGRMSSPYSRGTQGTTSMSSSERLFLRSQRRNRRRTPVRTSAEQRNRSLAQQEGYDFTSRHLESHPMWSRMYETKNGEGKGDDDKDGGW